MDLAMDMAILTALQLIFAGVHPLRLICAQLLLSAASFAAMALGRDAVLPFHLPLMLLGAAAVTGQKRCLSILRAALCMLALSMAAAGGCLLAGRTGGFASVGALALQMRSRMHPVRRWNIRVELELAGARASFPALIDTGNRLREHKSSLPVLIVEAEAAGAVAQQAEFLEDDRLRTLPYGVLGSSGTLRCFRPDGMRILLPDGGSAEIGDCWAAVYPGRIPGSTCALAPPEFFDAIEQASFNQGIEDRARRIIHGFFKCKAIHLRSGGTVSQGFGVLHRRQ